jgi:hypothetical protein
MYMGNPNVEREKHLESVDDQAESEHRDPS